MSSANWYTTEYTGSLFSQEQVGKILSRRYDQDGTRMLVIMVHGASGDARSTSSSGGKLDALVSAIADLGFPVISIDAGSNGGVSSASDNHPDTWGNQGSVNALAAAQVWGTAAAGYHDHAPGGKTGKVWLIGSSAGADVVLNFAARNTTLVQGITLIAGTVDLQDLVTNDGARGSFAAAIRLAYGPDVPGTPTGPTGTTGGGTSYAYKIAWTSAMTLGDGVTSAASTTTANLSTQANLGTTPVSTSWAAPTTVQPTASTRTGAIILRSVAAAAFLKNDTVGIATLTTATGLGSTTSLAVSALPFHMIFGKAGSLLNYQIKDKTTGTTQTITLTADAAAAATTLATTAFTPSVAYAVGSTVTPISYVDLVTATGSAYTAITDCWTTNGQNASPSWDPKDNLPAGLKAIPLQFWNSSGDATCVPAVVSSFLTAYGANAESQTCPGNPAHGSTAVSIANDGAALQTFLTFIDSREA